jgi:putative transposase
MPVRARLVVEPGSWRWSSYPGYARRTQRLGWVAYDDLMASWTGAFGGSDPAVSYRRYVSAGLSDPPESPWSEAHHGWLLGSRAFIDRVAAMVRGQPIAERRRESRLVQGLTIARVCEVVCAAYGIDLQELGRRGSRHAGRAAFAYLARRRTSASNRELATVLGLSRGESVPNLTRRFSAWLSSEARARRDLRRLEQGLDEGRPSRKT